MFVKKLKIISLILFVCVSCLFISSSFSDEEKKAEEPSPKASAEKSSYVYDLRSLIEKSKNNIQRVNDKIKEQAIYKRNLQREEKAREYYDRAMVLFEEGKINEARELFEKSVRITEHPEMKGYIKLSEKKFKSQEQAMRKEEHERLSLTVEQERERQKQVENAYDDGVRVYKQQNFKAARDEFMLVEQLIPEYKATRSYLKLVEEKIALQDKVDLVNQKKEILRQQQQAETERNREKEMWHKELALKEQERQRKISEQASKVYAEAMKLYKENKFVSAKEKFQEVEWVMPDYKSTRRYLEQLDKDIKDHEHVFAEKEKEHRAKKEWEDELTRKKLEAQKKKEWEEKSVEEKHAAAQEASMHYQKANDLMAEKKYTDARDEFLAVQKMYPGFKATDTLLSRLNKELGIIETAPDKVAVQVKGDYGLAVEEYKKKDFAAAKSKFEQVEFMYPDYMATRKYLAKLSKESEASSSGVEYAVIPATGSADIPKVGQEVDTKAYEALANKADPLYNQAIAFFDANQFDEALKQFEMVEAVLPNYKATRPYIKRVNHQIKKSEQQRYKKEQIQQAETINLLAKQANVLYTKILLLAADRTTSDAQKKFALVDRLFANMSKEQAKLLREIAEEEEKLRLEEIAYEQEVEKSEFTNVIDPIYQEAVRLYQARKYDEAKGKFLEAQSKISDYRSSSRYLGLIEKQNQLLQQTIKDRETQIAMFQSKAAESAELAAKLQLKAQESAMIRDLLAQAEAINDEIVLLSKDKNFEVIKEKFAQLEKIVDNLLTIKMAADQREGKETLSRQQKAANEKLKKDSMKSQESAPVRRGGQSKAPQKEAEEKNSVKDEDKTDPKKEELEKKERARISAQRSQAEKSKAEHRRIQREKDNQGVQLKQLNEQDRVLFEKAVQLFNAKNYPDAKARLVQLEHSNKYRPKARKYLEKIDNLALQDQNREIQKKEKDRQDYIESRAKRERISFNIQEANRDNVRQKSQSVQAALPVVTPMPRYPATRYGYLTSLNLRGRKSPVIEITDQSQVAQMKDSAQPVADEQKAQDQVKSQGMSPNEDASWLKRRNQKKLSDRRKKYLEDKKKAEEKKKEEEQKKIEEKRNAEIKAQEEKKAELERKKTAALQEEPTLQRQNSEQQAKTSNTQEAKAKAEALKLNLRQIKQVEQSTRRQRAQERKLRKLYDSELRATKNASSFNGALKELEAEKVKDQRSQTEKQKEYSRQQREDDKAQLLEKERKINNMINRGQLADLPLRGRKTTENAEKQDPLTVKTEVVKAPQPSEPAINPEQKVDVQVPISKEEVAPTPSPKPKPLVLSKRDRQRLLKLKNQYPLKVKAETANASRPSEPVANVEQKDDQNAAIAKEEAAPKAAVKPKPPVMSKKERKMWLKFKKQEALNAKAEKAAVSQPPEPASNAKQMGDYQVSISKQEVAPKAAVKPAPAIKPKPEEKKKEFSDKEAVRRKFENGLAKMYAEALMYYRKHMYKEARERFTDVEDISPNYKRTKTYLERIQEEILREQRRIEKAREDRQYSAIQQIDMPRIQKVNSIIPTAPAVNRLDAVSQALDDFESKKEDK